MNSTYITTNKDELKALFEQTPPDIQVLIKGGEVKTVASNLGQKFNIAVGKYVTLSNIITSILIGALDAQNVVPAIKEILSLSEEEAANLAGELETTILQKARNLMLGKPVEDVAVLEFKGKKTQDELRKEIMDTTKRESAIMKPQTSGIPKKTAAQTPGSRSQLLEQLQILSSIPNDEEVSDRLKHIQDQINSIKKKEDENVLESKIALKSFMFGEQGKETVEATLKTATYSVAPTRYNLDPYREVAED